MIISDVSADYLTGRTNNPNVNE